MAQIVGFSCDGPNCNVTASRGEAGAPALPAGWMTLKPQAVQGKEPTGEFHLHSNRCLMRLARERMQAAIARGDEAPTRPPGKKAKKEPVATAA